MQMKKVVRKLLKINLELLKKSYSARQLLDEYAHRDAILDHAVYARRPWYELDSMYSACRRELRHCSAWRHGPDRIYEVAREGYDGLTKKYRSGRKVVL